MWVSPFCSSETLNSSKPLATSRALIFSPLSVCLRVHTHLVDMHLCPSSLTSSNTQLSLQLFISSCFAKSNDTSPATNTSPPSSQLSHHISQCHEFLPEDFLHLTCQSTLWCLLDQWAQYAARSFTCMPCDFSCV